MNQKEKSQWTEKTKRLNENLEIKVGMQVKDVNGHKGIVVKIDSWQGETTEENHGTLYVWQSERTNYGEDNCEHYCLTNWKSMLRILI